MGADLYIKDLDREKQYRGFEVSKEAVEVGYFRDCYNDNGLFNFLRSNTGKEYSWWQFADRKSWFTVEDEERGNMTTKGAMEFLSIISEAKDILTKKKQFHLDTVDWAEFQKNPNKYSSAKGNLPHKKIVLTKAQTKEYFDWLNLLIAFLKLAIETESEIIWSV